MRVSGVVAALFFAASAVRPLLAAPGPAAVGAWERCVAEAEHRAGRAPQAFMAAGVAVGSGAISAAPIGAAGPCEVPDRSEATIQQWRGSVFIPHVTVGAVVGSLMSTLPVQDDVLGARLVSREGDRMRVQMRIVRRGIVTVVYDTEHDVTFSREPAGVATSRSVMTRIDEVIDAGTARERLRPADEDRGLLWRLNSYFRYSAVGGGVRVDLESLTLSRGIPVLLRPVARPVIESIARESVIRTLEGIRRRFEHQDRRQD